MTHRQVETASVHASSYHTGWIKPGTWEIVAAHSKDKEVDASENILPATYLDLSCQIHMPGQTKQWPKKIFWWNKDVHFHENLRLPHGTKTSENGMLVLFEAMASEGVTVALSPQPAYQKLSTFEITFGNAGNTKTTIVKKMGKAVSEVSFPCRVCHEGTWSNFWIAVWKGKIYAGVGNEPGQKCLAFLTDNEDDHTENPAPANATTGTATTEQEDKKDGTTTRNGGEEKSQTEDKKRASDSVLYIGMGNSAQQRRPVKIRHLHVTPVPSFVAVLLENTNDSSTMDVLMENMEEIDDDALKEYQEQCRRAKARAEKFGIEYKEPDMAAVVPWSQARKLRANPQKGFITGIDITNPDELAKQEVRKARFGELAVTTSKKRNLEGDDKDGDEEVEGTPKTANTQTQEDETSEAITSPTSAWDNEQMVRPERKDPPPSLWPIPPPEDIEKEDNEFAMETDKPVLVPEKIHLFSIDWAAFKQIRTEDIMAYFKIYGPSYVEWLGDLSCNVLFEDKFSAIRAMQAMAQDIPTPPPAELNKDDEDYNPSDLGSMGWKLGKKLVRKVKNDRFGRRGTTARVMMRSATSLDILVDRPNAWPKPPPGFSTKRILGPGSDFNTSQINGNDDNDNPGNRNRKRRKRNSDRDTSTGRGNTGTNRNNNNNNKSRGNKKQKRREQGNVSTAPSAAELLNQGLSSKR